MKRDFFLWLMMNVLICGTLSGQNFYLQSPVDTISRVRLQYFRPFIKGGDRLSGLAGTWELNAALAGNKKVNFYLSVPYTFYSVSGSDIKENGIGNITLLSQFAQRNGRTSLVTGISLPTSSAYKSEVEEIGVISDYYHLSKYAGRFLTFLCNFSYHGDRSSQGIFLIEAGPQFLISFNSFNAEILFNFGIQGGIRLSRLNLLAELTGLAILTERYLDVSERIMTNLILGTEFNLNRFVPGIFYNFYLNRQASDIDVLGFKLDYVFSGK